MIDYIRPADNLTVQEILKSSILFFFQSPPPDPKIVQIAPGFPVQNTPLKVRLYINLDAGVNSSSGMTTLTLSKVETFLDAFVQNASATLGVQVSGKETRLTIHSLRITFPISDVNDPGDLKKRTPCPTPSSTGET